MVDEKSIPKKMSDAAKLAAETLKIVASSISDIAQVAADKATEAHVAAMAIKLESKAKTANLQLSPGDDDRIAPTSASSTTASGRITPSYDDVLGSAFLARMPPLGKKSKERKTNGDKTTRKKKARAPK